MATNKRDRKSNDKAKSFREIGNQHLALHNSHGYFKALEYFNRSICYAIIGSECMALGYANRSSVHFQQNRPDRCMMNIEMAREQPFCPSGTIEKMRKREKGCALIQNTKRICTCCYAPKPVIELSYSPHIKRPFLLHCLELHCNPNGQSYIVANKKLPANKVIVVERAYCMARPKQMQYSHCEYCSVCLMEEVIPCQTCPHAIYCSIRCHDKAWRRYHYLECPVIDVINSQGLMLDVAQKLTIRLLLRGWSAFGSLKSLLKFAKDYAAGKIADVTLFDVDYTDGLSPVDEYRVIHCLPKHQPEKADRIAKQKWLLMRWSTNITPILRALIKQWGVNSVDCLQEAKWLMGFYARLVMSGINIGHTKCSEEFKQLSMMAIFPCVPLLGRLLEPNVHICTMDNRCIIVTTTTIEEGQPIIVKRFVIQPASHRGYVCFCLLANVWLSILCYSDR